MNILMMTNTYLPQVGGVAQSVVRFAEAFRGMGHRVLIAAPTYEEQPDRETDVVRVHAVQNFNGSDFSVTLPISSALDKALQTFEPDIVHAHHPFLIGSTAVRVARRHHVPLVFTYHTRYEYYTHYVPMELPRMQEFAVHLSTGYASLADSVLAPSESIAELLKQRKVTSPIHVVPTGIAPATFQNGDGRRARHHLGLPPDARIVGHVGRLAPEKNLDFLARAMVPVLARQANVHFLVVGHGPSVEFIRDCFRKSGLERRLHMPGSLTGQALVDAYHAMDLFVFASETETQGMVLTEAMAAGVPVVGLDAPGVREVVTDRVNGRLVHRKDPVAFADHVTQGLNWTPDQHFARQQAARATAEQFAMPQCARKALHVYDLARAALQQPRGDNMIRDSHWYWATEQIKAEWKLWTNMAGALTELLTNGGKLGDGP